MVLDAESGGASEAADDNGLRWCHRPVWQTWCRLTVSCAAKRKVLSKA